MKKLYNFLNECPLLVLLIFIFSLFMLACASLVAINGENKFINCTSSGNVSNCTYSLGIKNDSN